MNRLILVAALSISTATAAHALTPAQIDTSLTHIHRITQADSLRVLAEGIRTAPAFLQKKWRTRITQELTQAQHNRNSFTGEVARARAHQLNILQHLL